MAGEMHWENALVEPIGQPGAVQIAGIDWRTQIKPVQALGKLEDFVDRIALITSSVMPSVKEKKLLLFFGDHGVAVEGVSLMDPSSTRKVAEAVAAGRAVINVFADFLGIQLVPIDVGMRGPPLCSLPNCRVAQGTENFALGPAMTRHQGRQAVQVGFETGIAALDAGCQLLGIGEVGIGNTTSAAALFSALCGLPPGMTVGRGTGVTGPSLRKKKEVVKRALMLNRPNSQDPFDCLCKLGGFEIAAMVGAIIAGANRRVPVVVDGFVASAAALVASLLKPQVKDYFLISHLSGEKGHRKLLQVIESPYLLDLGMRLGEGTGTALAMFLLELGCRVAKEVRVF